MRSSGAASSAQRRPALAPACRRARRVPARPLPALGAALLAAALLAGCADLGTFGHPAPKPEPALNRPTADAEAAREYLASLQELQAGAPARQAELVQGARGAMENAPTTMNRLRYALMLALPGHGGADPVAARRQLSELLARPELLLPSERALAAVLLADVDERLVLIAENQRLQQEAASREKDRSAAANRRLQAEIEENARLQRALEEAQKKLDAVTQVERSITDRANAPPASPKGKP
jgi:hypothetical protein